MMHSILASLSVFVILNSMSNSVCGLPSGTLEAALNSILLPPKPLETCYNVSEGALIYESIRELAVDSEGRQCFGPIELEMLLYGFHDRSRLEWGYANATTEFCPTWAPSKQCLFDHLNSDKCNAENRKGAKDSVTGIGTIVIAELLCNPVKPDYLLHLVKSALDDGLWSCLLTNSEAGKIVGKCEDAMRDTNKRGVPFTALSTFFECSKSGIQKCAVGDAVKEEELVSLWVEIDKALQDAFSNFWSQLND